MEKVVVENKRWLASCDSSYNPCSAEAARIVLFRWSGVPAYAEELIIHNRSPSPDLSFLRSAKLVKPDMKSKALSCVRLYALNERFEHPAQNLCEGKRVVFKRGSFGWAVNDSVGKTSARPRSDSFSQQTHVILAKMSQPAEGPRKKEMVM
jgi:hypothetical protein